jgi:hypothetical protein
VKAEFDFNSWHAREHNSLVRSKLEKYLECAYAHYDHCERTLYHCVFASDDPGDSLADAQLQMIGRVFFPDLEERRLAFAGACLDATTRSKEVQVARMERLQAQSIAAGQVLFDGRWSMIPPTEQEKTVPRAALVLAYRQLIEMASACRDEMQRALPQQQVQAAR